MNMKEVLCMFMFDKFDILNNVIFAFKVSLLTEIHLMTVVINMHEPSICHVMVIRCHVSLKVLPMRLLYAVICGSVMQQAVDVHQHKQEIYSTRCLQRDHRCGSSP